MTTKTMDEVKHESENEMPSASGAIRVLYDKIAKLKERNQQLEEQIALMKVQMHGDCGVCKHRAGNSFDSKGVYISDKCGECMAKETRPHWEYEGLPEVKRK